MSSTHTRVTPASQRASSVTRRPAALQRQCAACDKKKKAPPPLRHEILGHAAGLQAKARIGRPDDPLEHEADRVADQVLAGGRVGSPGTAPLALQRDDTPAPPPSEASKYQDAAMKVGEALLETDLGKALQARAKEVGAEFWNTTEGKVVTGSAVAGAVAALTASNSELPLQVPSIPLDKLATGLSAKLTYEGPARSPTKAMLVFSGSFAAAPKVASVKPALTESEKFRAGTAAIAADQRKFQEGMKSPPERQVEKQAEHDALMKTLRPIGPAAPLAPLQLVKPLPSVEALAPKRPEDTPSLQRKASGCTADVAVNDDGQVDAKVDEPGDAPAIVDEVLASSGEPLEAGVREFMEARFGASFAHVRVHRDGRAARSAEAVSARAYTVGQHLAFGASSYQPHTEEGRRLIAHELTHVIQQVGAAPLDTDSREAGDVAPPWQADGIEGTPTVEPTASPTIGAAAAAAAAAAGAAGASPTSTPHLARAPDTIGKQKKKSWDITVESAYMETQHRVEADQSFVEGAPSGRRLLAFDVTPFYLPSTKGNVKDVYDTKAVAKGLSATVDLDGKLPRAGLWQQRADTGPLQTRWLKRVGWAGGKTADALWQKAGGDADFPKVGGQTCEMDHIVELQLGGTNVRENVQALDREDNGDSGGAIKQQVFQLATKLMNEAEFKTLDVSQVQFNFTKVETKATRRSPVAAAPTSAAACLPKGTARNCASVEACAQAIQPQPDQAAKAAVDREPYDISAGATPATLQVPQGLTATAASKKAKTAAIEDDPQNADAAELIPGLMLETLRSQGGVESVDSRIESVADKTTGKRKTRLPITIDKDRGKKVKLIVEKGGALKLADAAKNPNIAFTYRYLSAGKITHLAQQADGISGAGEIRPSVPLLKNLLLKVEFSPAEFKVVSEITKDKLKAPAGVRITQAALGLQLYPEFKPSGTLGFEIGPTSKPLGVGEITATADEQGLLAQGKLKAKIPGLDEAEGKVSYRPATGWAAEISAKTSQIPHVENAAVTARLNDTGLSVDGGLTLGLPGNQKVSLAVAKRGERIVYSGRGEFKVPGLDPVRIDFQYDGEHVKGKGKTGVTMRGLKGDVDLAYDDGKVTGQGKLALKKGRAEGSLAVKMDAQQRFSGEGSMRYQVSENLIATAGVVLHEDQRVTVKGALDFPKPIPLFKGINSEKELFKTSMTIPVPGASIGPIGLVLRITAALGARYGIGPGELRDVHLAASFNPLEDNPEFEGEMSANLVIPAHAGIYGSIEGAIAISAGIASISGGIRVTASADVEGGASASLKIDYKKGVYSLDAIAEISAGLILGLKVDGTARAEAGIGPFTVETEKVWNLAALKYDTGLKFGMKAPFHYASNEPFKAPALDQIIWTMPSLDSGAMLGKALAGGAQENKGAQA